MWHYEDFAESMEQLFYTNSNEKGVLTALIEELLDKQRFKNGLDIGAGQGLITQPLADRCQQLTLIEPAIKHANFLKNKFTHAQVFPGVFQDFKSDEQFDIILCAHMLYYLQPVELIPTLNRMVNMLVPGGHLILINAEVDFIFNLFSEKIGDKFKVFLPATNEIIASLLPFGKCETMTSQYEKTFSSDNALLPYLAEFLSVSDKEVLSCPTEVQQVKNMLKREGIHSVLEHVNSVIYFTKK